MNNVRTSMLVALSSVTIAGVWAVGCRQPVDRRASVAAAALFGEFETVVKADVSQLPFEVVGRGEPDPRQMLFLPFGFLFAALDTLGESTSERIAGETAVLLGGMKDFRGPTGLGGVSSRNCYVLVVKPGFSLARSLGKTPTGQVNGAPLWRWSARIHEYGEDDDRPSTVFALEAGPSHVLVSNDEQSIRRVADSLERTAQHEGLLDALTEWKDVSRSPYWAYRRYRFADVGDPMAAAIDRVRRDAESLVLFTRPERQTAVLRLVSTQRVATGPEKLLDDTRLPSLSPVTSRSWETSLSLLGGDRESEAMFLVMGFMGFAVYL